MSRFISLAFIVTVVVPGFSQEKDLESAWKRNRVLVAIGHMGVGQGIDVDGNRSWLSIPVWMIDYDYSLTRKWTLGVHNDIITESFKVEGFFLGEETETIEREKPIATLLVVSYKPGEHAVYSIGNGGEFSSSGNYFLTQVGFEYGFELPGEWELSPALAYDLKWNAYDSFSISLGVGKKF